jgi:hypothetical protein
MDAGLDEQHDTDLASLLGPIAADVGGGSLLLAGEPLPARQQQTSPMAASMPLQQPPTSLSVGEKLSEDQNQANCGLFSALMQWQAPGQPSQQLDVQHEQWQRRPSLPFNAAQQHSWQTWGS